MKPNRKLLGIAAAALAGALLAGESASAQSIEAVTTVRLYRGTTEIKPYGSDGRRIPGNAELYGRWQAQDIIRSECALDFWGMIFNVLRLKGDVANIIADISTYNIPFAAVSTYGAVNEFEQAWDDIFDSEDQFADETECFDLTYPNGGLYDRVEVNFEARFPEDSIAEFKTWPEPLPGSGLVRMPVRVRGHEAPGDAGDDGVDLDGRNYDNVKDRSYFLDLDQLWKELGTNLYSPDGFVFSFKTRTDRTGDNLRIRHVLRLRVRGPAPVVSRVYPTAGKPGDVITLEGTNLPFFPGSDATPAFAYTRGVVVGGTPVPWVQVEDDLIRFTIPSSVTRNNQDRDYKIAVVTVGGSDDPCERLTVYRPPSPSIAIGGLTNNTARPGDVLTLTGENLRDVTSIAFTPTSSQQSTGGKLGGGSTVYTTAKEITVGGKTGLLVAVPLGAPPKTKIVVTTRGGVGETSIFDAVPNAPLISSVAVSAPDVMGEKTIAVLGANFDTGTVVYFGNIRLTVKEIQPLYVRCQAPLGTNTGRFVVATGKGVAATVAPMTITVNSTLGTR